MAYTINRTDGTIFSVVPDGQVDTDTSLVLVGKNYAGYGELLNENFFKLLENHANAVAPTVPVIGQLWFDKATNILKVYNGTDFRSLGGAIAGPTAPTGNNNGDFWWDSTNKQLKVWDTASVAFITVGPLSTSGTGQSGAIPRIVTDTGAVDHVIVEVFVGGTVTGIISKDPVFTPAPLISGFTNLSPGYNAATGTKFVGTATDSDALGGAAAADFIQVNPATTQTISDGLGITGVLTLGPAGQTTVTAGATTTTIATTSTAGYVIGTTGAPSAITVANTGAVVLASTLTSPNTIQAATFIGSGSGLTTLSATQLTTGTVPNAAISGSYTGFANATGSGTATFANLVGAGAGITALNATQLTSGIVPDGRLSGNYTTLGALLPAVNNTSDLGSSSFRWATIYGTTFNGVATSALYADLAERFVADADYPAGTVVRLGGEAEITQENESASSKVFGVISTDPAFLMNRQIDGVPVALIGRVPVRVDGTVKKGDRLVSAGNGYARAALVGEYQLFNVIGRALEDKTTQGEGLVEAFVSVK